MSAGPFERGLSRVEDVLAGVAAVGHGLRLLGRARGKAGVSIT